MNPFSTLTDLADGLRNRQFSSVELTRFYLDRIERLDVEYNSFITVTRDRAQAQAAAADAKLRGGNATPLTGLPIAHKDIFCTAGRSHQLRIEDARYVHRAVRRNRCRAPRCSGRGDARQDQHGRVRDGLVVRNELLRTGSQSVGYRRACPADHRAVRRRRSPPGSRRLQPAPIPADRSANRLHSAASAD